MENAIREKQLIKHSDKFSTDISSWGCNKFLWPITVLAIIMITTQFLYILSGKSENFPTFIITFPVIAFFVIGAIVFLLVGFIPMATYGLIIPAIWILLLPYLILDRIAIKFKMESTLIILGILISIVGIVMTK